MHVMSQRYVIQVMMSHCRVVLERLLNYNSVSQVSAEVSRRSLSMTVDGSSPDSVSVKGNQLDVENRLYLGGLPHTHTARRINVGHFLYRPITALEYLHSLHINVEPFSPHFHT